MEDYTQQPSAGTASLYNGQSTATNPSSHTCTGLASRTSSTLKSEDGVSVENTPSPTKLWYVLRVSYGRIVKAKAYIEANRIECYVPLRYKEIKEQGKQRIVTGPLLSSFIFVHETKDRLEALIHSKKQHSTEGKALLTYYYDHTTFRTDCPDRNPPLTVPDEAMDNFIRLTSIENPHIIPVTSPNIQCKMGDHVVVTEGAFKGIHGRVARIAGQQRVVVELFDGCLVATAYVPKSAMKTNID